MPTNPNPFLRSSFDAVADQQAVPVDPVQAPPVVPSPVIPSIPMPERAAPEVAAPAVSAPAARASTDNLAPPPELRDVFEASARAYNVPVNVLMALGHQESRYDTAAVGQPTKWGRAKGVMQFLDSTADGLGINPLDPNQAIPAAAKQLRDRLDKGYSMDDAVKEHFAGPDRNGWGEKTRVYGDEVLGKAGEIAKLLYGEAPAAPDGTDAPAAADPNQAALDKLNGVKPNSFSTSMPRSAYQATFQSMNPQAGPAAIQAVMAQYDAAQEARNKVGGNRVQDKFAQMASPEATFDAKLNKKLQAKNQGLAQALPGNQQPANPATPAQASPGIVDTIGGNAIGGAMAGLAGFGAAGASVLGMDATAKELDDTRSAIEARMHELGGESITGKASALVGGVAPALAAPPELMAQLLVNAGVFAMPAARDTYKAQIAKGASENLAVIHAAEAAGINLVMPTVATRGVGALAGKLGAEGLAGVGGAAANLGKAAAEGVGFSAANSVIDKGTDVLAGAKNDRGWIDPADMAASALGFGALRAGHIAGHAMAGEPVAQPARAPQVDPTGRPVPVAAPAAAPRGGSVADQLRAARPLDEVPAAPVVSTGPLTDAVHAAVPTVTPAEAAAPAGPLSDALHSAAADHAVNPAAPPEMPVAPVEAPAPPPLESLTTDALRAQLKEVAGTIKEGRTPELVNQRKAIEREIGTRAKEAKDATAKLNEEPTSMGPFDTAAEAAKMAQRVAAKTAQVHEVVPDGDKFVLKPHQENIDGGNETVAATKPDGAGSGGTAVRLGPADAGRPAKPGPVPVIERTDAAGNAKTANVDPVRADAAADGKPALTGKQPASWVIRNRETGEVVMETYDKKKVDALNTEKYEAVPINQHLTEFNASLRGPQPGVNAVKPADRPLEKATDAQLSDRLRRVKSKVKAEGWTDEHKAARDAVQAEIDRRNAADVQAKQPKAEAAPAVDDLKGKQIDKEWHEFAKDSGTLNVDRAEMPQVKAEQRGAFTQFLLARGIAHEQMEMPAGDLKPTQREFSPAKVEKAKNYEGGERSILVSSDNHVLDGHHQWLAKMDGNEPVKVIKLDAPIKTLLAEVKEFPSAEVRDGATEAAPPEPAKPRVEYQKQLKGAPEYMDPASRGVVDYMNGDISKAELIKRFADAGMTDGQVRSVTDRISDSDGGWTLGDRFAVQREQGKYSVDDPAGEADRKAAAKKPSAQKVPEVAPEAPPAPASVAKTQQAAREEAIAALAEQGTKALREVAANHKRSYMREAAANILADRAEAVSAQRSQAMKQRLARESKIDPDTDHMAQAIAKMGGINRESARGRMRLAPEELNVKANVGNLARNVFVKNGGMTMDQAGAAMAELGYVPHDEHGKHDQSEWEDSLAQAAGGDHVYTAAGMVARAEAERAMEMDELQAKSEAEFHEIEHHADALEKWADDHEIVLPDGHVLYHDEHDAPLISEKDIHDYFTQGEAEGAGPADLADSSRQARPSAETGADAPAEGTDFLQSQSAEDLKAKDARAGDQTLADKELADAQVGAFSLSAPEGSVTGEANAMSNSRQEHFFDLKDNRTIEINGVRRPIENSEGHVIATNFKEQKAFYNWFGDSKAVDKDGAPLVVYHGSPDARFVNEDGIFATMKDRMLKYGATPESKRAADRERGFFFTTSRAVAKTYADPHRSFDYQNAEESVIPTYLSIKNPLEFDATGLHWREAQKQISKDDFIARAKDAGHDGVVIRNVRDSYDSMRGGKDPLSDVYVAFKSEQIKHAEKNNGNFDPSDPSILHDLSALMADGPLSRLEEPKRVVVLAELKRLQKLRGAGKIDDEGYRGQVENLIGRLEGRNERNADAKLKAERERGPLWVEERLMRAMRTGELDSATVDFALWALRKSPSLAADLAISLKSKTAHNSAGSYESAQRIMTLLKNGTNSGTAVHEMLHHTERMMPAAIQHGINKAWFKAYMSAWDKADPATRPLIEDLLAGGAGDKAAFERIIKAFRNGKLKYDEHYQLVNQSEFWAVNATRIMAGRFDAATSGWGAKAKQWMTEMVQHLRGVLGMKSDAPILKALDQVLNGDGTMVSKKMLGQLPVVHDIAAPPPAAAPEEPARDDKSMRESLARVLKTPIDAIKSAAFNVKMTVIPMATGEPNAQKIAKDFANDSRKATAQWTAFDNILRKNYTTEQLEAMWHAADAENDLRRAGKTSDTEGINSLPPDQRETIDVLHQYGEALWKKAQDAGMVEGDGVAYWTPRMAAHIVADGSAERITTPNGEFSKEARNLSTTAKSMKHRAYDTTAESEAALKEKMGDDTAYVKNIRVMPLAMAQLERAIAGRTLVNQIKAHGKVVGDDLISDNGGPNFITIDHPALKQWRPKADWLPADMDKLASKKYEIKPDGVYKNGEKLASYKVGADGQVTQLRPVMDETGKPVMQSSPLYVRKDFAGPLKSVFTSEPNKVYQTLMELKGAVTSMIMISPLTHNLVIWGKAMPTMVSTMGWKNNLKNAGTMGLHAYFVGNTARGDHALMSELIGAGLVPVSGRGMNPDLPSIANGIKPGRSLAAKAVGAVLDMVSPKAGDMGRKTVDKVGEVWHETLLWDRVADMQAGMAVMMRASLMDKGIAQYDANRIATHFANRYAGMIPREAMSEGAHMLLNMSLFSKSFTVTNLGAYKDFLGGLPGDVQSQIRLNAESVQRLLGRDEAQAAKAGNKALAAAQRQARAKGAMVLALDIGAMTTIASLAQAMVQGQSWQQISDDFKDRLKKLGIKAKNDPLSIIGHPIDSLASLSQTSDNPHGKEDRVRMGSDEQGNSYYMRLPVGKVGEELKQYSSPGSALHLLHNKMSTFVKPLADIANNQDFSGHSVYKPTDNMLKQVAAMASYWVKSQFPVEEMLSAGHLASGTADHMDKLKLLGMATGLSISKVKGGDAVAEMRWESHEHAVAVRDVLPQVQEALRRGEGDKARQIMVDAGASPQEIKSAIRKIQNPGRVTTQSRKNFNKHATDEQRTRMDRMLQQQESDKSNAQQE